MIAIFKTGSDTISPFSELLHLCHNLMHSLGGFSALSLHKSSSQKHFPLFVYLWCPIIDYLPTLGWQNINLFLESCRTNRRRGRVTPPTQHFFPPPSVKCFFFYTCLDSCWLASLCKLQHPDSTPYREASGCWDYSRQEHCKKDQGCFNWA